MTFDRHRADERRYRAAAELLVSPPSRREVFRASGPRWLACFSWHARGLEI